MSFDLHSEQRPQLLLPTFSSEFLEDHAGLIIHNPAIAIVELVSNSWDAGADRVEITWPAVPTNGRMIIEDNGTGMSGDEFTQRWLELSYNRIRAQGRQVNFPEGNMTSPRPAYGRNGKGRHSMFCFSNEYEVETWREGRAQRFQVKRNYGTSPFTISRAGEFPKDGHGTILSAELIRNYINTQSVRELIGSKFVSDPSFRIFVNGEQVELTDLEGLSETEPLHVEGVGTIIVHRLDSRVRGRTSRQHGVAWWVNRRLVGEPSWRGFDDLKYLDARSTEAKRYTFVVEADPLQDDVKADWSDFKDTSNFQAVHADVKEYILSQLDQLFHDARKIRKIEALQHNKEDLRDLPVVSRKLVGEFVDEIQKRSPGITERDLSAAVEVLANLEKSRSGYALLEQLAKLDPDDLDSLNEILDSWTVHEARVVLDVLGARLKLIQTLERMVENPSTDELHEIQPLFEQGLWIFGPEYETIEFTSNRTLATVIRKLFGDDEKVVITNPRRRPDFVVLPDTSIGVYSSDSHDEVGEVNGIAKVLIVELKKGGFQVTKAERRQAEDYASELRKSSKVQDSTIIVGFVLGATIASDTKPIEETNTRVFPMTYNTVLQKAHARTFNLLQKIQAAKQNLPVYDPDVEQVVSGANQLPFVSLALEA